MTDRSNDRRARSFPSLAFWPLLALCAAALAWVLLPRSGESHAQQLTEPANDKKAAGIPAALEVRMGLEQLRNPYWYEQHGQAQEAKDFWDKNYWERALGQWAEE